MIKIRYLNSLCSKRIVATSAPSQVFCRILGNSISPCYLDKLCQQTQKRGLCFFYSTLGLAFFAIFSCCYWVLKLSKLNKFFLPLLIFILKPLDVLFTSLAWCYKFYRELPR